MDSLTFGTAGIVSTPWRGPWDSTITYTQFDSVSYAGSSWLSIVSNNTNVTPGTDDTKWNLLASIGGFDPTLELAVYIPGLFNSNQEMIFINVVRAFSLPINLTGSAGTLGVASTGSVVFTLKKNGSSIGTLTFAAGNPTGTFSFSSGRSFAVNDTFGVYAPSGVDATAAHLAITLLGTKT